jgi:cohesin loading factor subunit SCC2
MLTIPAVLQKIHAFFEDIFEDSDSFSAEPSPEDIRNSKFFASLSTDGHPLLAGIGIDKIARHVLRAQGKNKRHRPATISGDDAKWDEEAVARLMKLLQRSMRESENLVVFPDDALKLSPAVEGEKMVKGRKKKPAKPKKGEGLEESTSLEESSLDDAALTESESRLVVAVNGMKAVDCCLVILECDGLSKQVSCIRFQANGSSSRRIF